MMLLQLCLAISGLLVLSLALALVTAVLGVMVFTPDDASGSAADRAAEAGFTALILITLACLPCLGGCVGITALPNFVAYNEVVSQGQSLPPPLPSDGGNAARRRGLSRS
jgi:heme A synthase